jgi:hypothetical protein
MNIKNLLKNIWLFIFSLTHPATIGLLIFYLGETLNITFLDGINVTLIDAQAYFSCAIIFNLIWYTALYFISSKTKNHFNDLLNYNLGLKHYPIYTTLLITNSLWLLLNGRFLVMCLFVDFQNIALENIDSIVFILFILSLSYLIHIHMLHILFAIYGYITLKTFYMGMESNIFGFLFALPTLFLLIQSFVLFIKQSWMLIKTEFSLKN